MEPRILVGTEDGLFAIQGDAMAPVEGLAGYSVTALTRDGERIWVITDGRTLWEHASGGELGAGDASGVSGSRGSRWRERGTIAGLAATCIAPARDGLLVGIEQAHVLRWAGERFEPIESFDTADGRDTWYTPWGDPADVRSIAITGDGTIHVNVHVGGVVRSRDGGRTWTPTVDIEVDVHQVLAHPTDAEVVLVAAYDGFGISRDGGASWAFVTEGMHAHYARAVAVADDVALVSVSTGPGGRKSAIYRAPLAHLLSPGERSPRFERCREGLPDSFGDNIDTGCLAAAGQHVVAGTADGRVFRSADAGARWTQVTKGLPRVSCLALA